MAKSTPAARLTPAPPLPPWLTAPARAAKAAALDGLTPQPPGDEAAGYPDLTAVVRLMNAAQGCLIAAVGELARPGAAGVEVDLERFINRLNWGPFR